MAKLIPHLEAADIQNRPERDVAEGLVGGLDDSCFVFHSYPWLRPERHDHGKETFLVEGEADFVVFSPDFGLLDLEVKGGTISYDPSAHRWYRRTDTGKEIQITDPFEQGRRNIHALVDQIQKRQFRNDEHLPCAFGYAVIFPDCEHTGPLPPGADSGILLTSKDLGFLGRRIPEVVKKWDRQSSRPRLGRSDINRIVEGLSPTFRLMPILSRQVASQEDALVRLTDRQQEALEGLYANPRVLVHGVAGSGKTMLAMARALRFAEEGKKTLFLCYNKGLADWLAALVPEKVRHFLSIHHFHGLCSEWCWKAGIPFKVPSDDNGVFWKDDAANLLDRAIDRISTRFDAIVVDEAQDFYPNWWMPIELLNTSAEDGLLYVFCDPAQNLFVDTAPVLPELSVQYSLPTNCRNTRRIAAACGKIRGIEIAVRREAPDGNDARIQLAPHRDQQRAYCENQVREWLNAGKLKANQIAILSPTRQENCSLAGMKAIGGSPIVDTLTSWKEGRGVLHSTVRAFKGLEADALVVIDISGVSPVLTQADLYVACSRAKHLLTVLTTSDGVL
jgi:ATP:corrinoid adenosyltransferase